MPPFDAFFACIDGTTTRRLCLHHAPSGAPRAAVLHVHAFAEEMNKSRRMCARTARALAAEGFAVLQIDLFGCGDADGEWAQVTWAAWQADLAWAAAWLARRWGDVPLWLWGQRAGALLATACATSLDRDCNLLLWNPVLQGKAVTQQFLRLAAAADWARGDGKAASEQAKADWAAGRSVEIAGYALNADLVRGLDGATLAPPPVRRADDAPRLVWLEVAGRDAEPMLSPAAQLQRARWEGAGYRTHMQAIAGPAFWQTVEIEDAPDLIGATVDALAGRATTPGRT